MILEIVEVEVENIKSNQNIGLHVHKNVKCLLYEMILTYNLIGFKCCGVKNDRHFVIKHGYI